MKDTAAVSFDNTRIAFRSKPDKELKKAYYLFKLFNQPILVDTGAWLTQLGLKLHLPIKPLIRHTVFERFVGGETLEDCIPTIDRLAEENIHSILDYGVEGKGKEKDFNNSMYEQLRAVEFAAQHQYVPVISCKITALGRFGLLQKIHEGGGLSVMEQQEFERVVKRVDTISARAAERGTGIFFDSEETWIQKPVDNIIIQMMSRYNRNAVLVFNTYQLYRQDRLEQLKQQYAQARENSYLLGAKLVRGAYMEKERARARKLGYPSPIHPDKDAVDRDYDAAVAFCIKNLNGIKCFVASHNEQSCQYATELLDKYELAPNHPHLWFSQLYGMGEHITSNLAAAGYNVTKYIPYGPVREVVPYLIRRAEENTSVAGQMSRELKLIMKEMERRGIQ